MNFLPKNCKISLEYGFFSFAGVYINGINAIWMFFSHKIHNKAGNGSFRAWYGKNEQKWPKKSLFGPFYIFFFIFQNLFSINLIHNVVIINIMKYSFHFDQNIQLRWHIYVHLFIFSWKPASRPTTQPTTVVQTLRSYNSNTWYSRSHLLANGAL